MNILQFAELLDLDLSPLKKTILKATYHLPLSRKERSTFEHHAQRKYDPRAVCNEIVLLCGRRGGKTHLSVLIALYELLRPETRERLTPGEAAVGPVISPTRDTARVLFERARYLAETNPHLQPLVRSVQDAHEKEIEFSYDERNRLYLRVMPANKFSVLGRSCPVVVVDEAPAMAAEGVKTADGIVQSLTPSLTQFEPHGKVILLGTPGVKAGRPFDLWKRRAELERGGLFNGDAG